MRSDRSTLHSAALGATLLIALSTSFDALEAMEQDDKATCREIAEEAEAHLKGVRETAPGDSALGALAVRGLHECNNASIDPRVRGRLLLVAGVVGSNSRESLSVLQEAERVLREEAPRAKERVTVLEHLATNWMREGAFDLAASAADESLKLRSELWGSKSPEAVDGKTFMAYFYLSQAGFRDEEASLDRARAAAQEAVDFGSRVLGANSPATMRAWVALASAIRAQGQPELADEIMSKHVTVDLASLAENLSEAPPGP